MDINKQEIFDFLKKTVLPKINHKAVKTMIENDRLGLNVSFFDDFFKSLNIKEPVYSSDQLSEAVKENLSYIKDYGKKLNVEQAIKGKRELTYSEMVDIKEGDYVSQRKGRKFIQGIVVQIRDKDFIVAYKGKPVAIEKMNTIKFFPGQKFDAREIGYNLMNLEVKKTPDKKIDFKDVMRNYNLNSVYLTFSDLNKSNRFKLLKGQETGVFNINVKIEQNGEFISKAEKIRLKAYVHNGEVMLQKVKGFDASKKMIYNVPITDEQILLLKTGKTLVIRDISRRDGKTFNAAAFWDNGLQQIRTKSLNEKPLEKLRVLGNYHLNEKELEKLNFYGELILKHKNKSGQFINYKITYDLPLNKVKVSKEQVPSQDREIFNDTKKAEEKKQGNVNKQTNNNKKNNKKKPNL